MGKILDDDPELWEQYSDLAAVAREKWIEIIAGTNLLAAESLRRRVEAMHAELAGDDPLPVIRLLAERVTACWLQLHHAEYAAAATVNSPLKMAAFIQSRLESAERRYSRAIGAMLTAQKLLQPTRRPAASEPGPSLLRGLDYGATKVHQECDRTATGCDQRPRARCNPAR